MASPKVPKDKFFEKVINPYPVEVMQYPQSIEMHEGVLHIHDVEGSKRTRSVEARLEEMEQQLFKCQGMVERGLNANHMMITEFTNKHKIDAKDIGEHLFKLYDRIDHLQAQIYDLQNQNCEVQHASQVKKAADAMEHLLPHEIAEWELEMHKAVEIEERQEEELRMDEDELEKILSNDKSALEYPRKLYHNH
ncbi:DNA-directed RNA polymerase II subunit RPB1 [Hordeum vulgare]|nr:DNA-directed RNA polymerase II subunit RPB1 [Hordeum vulgare]